MAIFKPDYETVDNEKAKLKIEFEHASIEKILIGLIDVVDQVIENTPEDRYYNEDNGLVFAHNKLLVLKENLEGRWI